MNTTIFNKTLPFIILVLLFACTNKKTIPVIKVVGLWQQVGYGKIIRIDSTMLQVYDISTAGCVSSSEKEILDFGKIISYTNDTLIIQHGIDHWKFSKLSKLPAACNPMKEITKTDPKLNFEHFWHTYNEHYVSFTLKNVDWKAIYNEFEPQITKNTSDTTLYTIFNIMMDRLNDGHLSIEATTEIEAAYSSKKAPIHRKYSKIDEFKINKGLAEMYVDSLRNYNAGMARYGMINSDIGYIQINAMQMLADYKVSENEGLRNFYNEYWTHVSTRKNEEHRTDEVEGINTLLNTILTDLAKAKTFIIDLRFNGGGKDGVALEILNHFTNKKGIAATKKAKQKNGFTPKQALLLKPASQHFDGKVYLLMSQETASASEVLLLASLANPQFIKVGSTTEGIFSSTLDKILPNGWIYELSNEIYEDLTANSYENIGISPDIIMEYPTNKDDFLNLLNQQLDNKKDEAIDLIINFEK